MNKQILNYIVDFLMAIAFIFTTISLFTNNGVLHEKAGWTFIILAITHFLLHLPQIVLILKNTFAKKESSE